MEYKIIRVIECRKDKGYYEQEMWSMSNTTIISAIKTLKRFLNKKEEPITHVVNENLLKDFYVYYRVYKMVPHPKEPHHKQRQIVIEVDIEKSTITKHLKPNKKETTKRSPMNEAKYQRMLARKRNKGDL